MSDVEVMPVCIKPEPQDTRAGLSKPKPPVPPQVHSSNGSSTVPGTQPSTATSLQSAGSAMSSCGPTNGTVVSSSVQGASGAAAEKEKVAAVSEDAIDYDSVRGVFGWATLDNVNVPYIIRKFRKFVAVRIVEKKVLNKYPNSFPDELGKKEPLVSYFVTEAEANLLNEINTIHCSFEYGHQLFTTKDLIVDLAEFEDFYNLVKKTFPEDVLATIATDETSGSTADEKKIQLAKVCGWMQINNTVTPYITRSAGKFVPLSVIQYAAQLLTKDQVEGHSPTVDECKKLNETCKAAGFDFTFGKNTKLIHIAEVLSRCPVSVFPLPFENPLAHAQYIDTETASRQPSSSVAAGGVAGSMALPYQSKPILSEGPPNLNPFTPYNPFMSMMNMITQAPVSSSHMLPRNTPSSVTVPTGQQLSIVPTQTAPVFFPPAPHSMTRAPQVSGNTLMSQGLGVAEGAQTQTVIAPHTAVIPGSRPSVSYASGMNPQFTGRGGLVVPSGRQCPDVPCPPAVSHAPPPSYPGVVQARQQTNHPGHPSVSNPHVTVAHSFVSSHLAGQQGSVVIPGVGPVPRGTLPITGFPRPPGVVSSGEVPRHIMPESQPRPPSQAPSQSQPGLLLQPYPLPQPPALHPSPSSSLPTAVLTTHTSTGTFQSGHVGATTANSVTSVLPVPVGITVQTRDFALRSAGGDMVSKPERTVRPVSDDHLKLVGDIRPEMVNGKSISCIVRNSPTRKGSYCLVEAVAKLYFPKCNLAEFVNALQNVLGINLPVCSEHEAKAFIHFYNLPVAKLNDNHMICLQDLKNYFPQILYMFRHSSSDTASLPVQPQPLSTRRFSSSEAPKLASPSAPITIVLNNNDSSEVINLDSGPSTPSADSPSVRGVRQATKRKAEEGGGVGGQSVQSALQQNPAQRGDEVDGQGSKGMETWSQSSGQQPASTSQVIVID